MSPLYEVVAVAHGDTPGTAIVSEEIANGSPRWTYWTVDTGARLTVAPGPVAQRPATEGCVADHCYRAATGLLRVDERPGAGEPYHTAWSVDGVQNQRLCDSYYQRGDPAVHVSSTSVVVLAAVGGHVVFVADGRDGLLYRDVSGHWRRLGFAMIDATSHADFVRPTRIPIAASARKPAGRRR